VRSAHDSSAHLLRLIDSVLDLSRVESGKQELAIDTTDAGAPVEECVEATRPSSSRCS
jgi:signal transduction histidine kinase